LEIGGTIEAQWSLIFIKHSYGMQICIVVVDGQLLVFDGDTGDEMEFFLQRKVSDLGICPMGGMTP
jgi:hypothetical protein